jgi:two-component system, NarL family, invasion response regulator UvrY
MEKYKIALADDHALIRKGLVELINSFENYEVMFHVNNGQDLIDQINAGRIPDIAMLDVNMPRKDGYETASWLKENHSNVLVLALSMYDDESAIIRMLRSGAKGYIFKDAEPRELKQALDSIAARGYHYSELITGHLIHNINQEEGKKTGRVGVGFSEREIEFLRLVCSELGYREIGEVMHLSPRTIEGYRDTLCDRLHLKSRIGLVLYALKSGIVSLNHIDLKCGTP